MIHTKSIKLVITVFVTTMFLASQYSFAQSKVSIEKNANADQMHENLSAAEIALKIGRQIEANKLFLDDNLPSKIKNDKEKNLAQNLKEIQSAFFKLNDLSYSKLSNEYDRHSQQNQSKSEIKAAKLFKNLEPFTKFEEFESQLPQITLVLENAVLDEDWFVASIAWSYLSYLEATKGDLNSALQATNNALSLMPNEISHHVTQMRILLTESLALLNARLRNLNLTAINTDRLIQFQIEAGQQVDGSMHLNNLIYVFSHWRDHETAQALAKILLKNESVANSGTPGLTHMRLAQTMNEQSEFAQAFEFANQGLSMAKNETLITSLTALRIIALAGIGRVDEASEEIAEFKQVYSTDNQSSEVLKAYIIYADALIAFGRGDIALGQKLMTRRMDKYIQSTLKISNESTAELIATLENSKGRQIERQNALQREADLREAELKQKTVTNYLLLVLSSIMAIAAILSGVFARYRSVTASRLRVARDQAKAGEKAKSEFLAIMSHELRTPLNGIIGIADLLAATAPTDELKHKNGIILKSGNELLGLVEAILDMSRLEAGELEVFHEMTDIREIVQKLDMHWRPQIEEKGIVFTTFVDQSVPDLFSTDDKRIRQCIASLISNAVKFTKTGRIHVHLTSVPAEKKGDMILSVIVADTGSGIREEVMHRLFKPFVQADESITRHFGGAGLGLAITRSLARMLGGDISLVTRDGRGSEFTLTFQGAFAQNALSETTEIDAELDDSATKPNIARLFKASEQKPSVKKATQIVTTTKTNDENTVALIPVVPKAKPIDQNGIFSGLTVLIVEDIVSNQDIIKLFLGPKGCKFVTANNGVDALRALEIYEFDLILMDIRMPEMDGIEATERIRTIDSLYRNIPIIALTADKTDETQNACKAAGVDLFLTKPVIAKDLISAVRFVIEHPPRLSTNPYKLGYTETTETVASGDRNKDNSKIENIDLLISHAKSH